MKIEEPNFTQKPKDLIDHWLPNLKEVETKVLLVIIRKTFGRQKTSEATNLPDLEKLTGSSKASIIKAIKSLIEKGILSKEVGQKACTMHSFPLIAEEDSSHAS